MSASSSGAARGSRPESPTAEHPHGEPLDADAAAEPALDDAEADPAASAPEEAAGEPGLRAFLRETYLRFDRRTLGLTRFFLGFLLVMDLLHRGRIWRDMYSNVGVLPNHLNLFRPQAWGAFSLFNAFSTPAECWALWAVMLATFVCLMAGYRTRLMQVLSLVFVTSMNGRVLLIENGGYVVHNLLLLWTCFLPLGDRFSVDALLASMRARREGTAEELNDRTAVTRPAMEAPLYTALGPILFLQLASIYFFNVVHKTGPAWHDGTAVHYVIYNDRMVTPLIALIRDHVPNPIILFSTRSTMAFEASIPLCLLSPLAPVWTRRLAVFMINTLHLAFGVAMTLGPFAWALCVFSTLLFGTEDWELAIRTMRRTHRARTVVYERTSGAALFFCRVLKRLDNLELLTFRAEDGVPGSLRVEAPGGAVTRRAAALADIVAALPLGPTVAWTLRLPGLRSVVDALFARNEGREVSAHFGLRVPARPAPPPDEPAPARRSLGGALRVLRDVGAVVMFAGAVNQAMTELWVINRRVKVPQPEPMQLLSLKLRFLQGWFMFSPNPVMDDGTLVVDALTVDGRHVDPFSGKAPDFDLLNAKSYRYCQAWGDYYARIHLPANTAYRDAMKDYLLRYPERTGHPEDALVSADVYWIQDLNPKWNETRSYNFEKLKLFSFEAPPAPAKPPSG